MAFVPVPATMRVAITFEDNAGNQAANVIHVRSTTPPVDGTTLNTVAGVVEDWLDATWSSFSPTTWRAINIDILDLTVDDSLFLSSAVDVQGLDTAEPLPSFNTVAISLRSAFAGRSRRGRLYHVGMSDSRVAGDYVTEAAATTYINGYESLRSAFLADDLEWVVVSYVADGAPRVSPLVTPITNITLTDRKIDHQLRRSPN